MTKLTLSIPNNEHVFPGDLEAYAKRLAKQLKGTFSEINPSDHECGIGLTFETSAAAEAASDKLEKLGYEWEPEWKTFEHNSLCVYGEHGTPSIVETLRDIAVAIDEGDHDTVPVVLAVAQKAGYEWAKPTGDRNDILNDLLRMAARLRGNPQSHALAYHGQDVIFEALIAAGADADRVAKEFGKSKEMQDNVAGNILSIYHNTEEFERQRLFSCLVPSLKEGDGWGYEKVKHLLNEKTGGLSKAALTKYQHDRAMMKAHSEGLQAKMEGAQHALAERTKVR